jgi:hypothetical protein
MNLGPFHRRLTAMTAALAIFVVGVPMLPASAATIGCDQAATAMPASMPMMMDMKSIAATPEKSPAKPHTPCSDMGMNCIAGGCAAPSMSDQSGVTPLPPIGAASVAWETQIAGPSMAYKPALPPPIAIV